MKRKVIISVIQLLSVLAGGSLIARSLPAVPQAAIDDMGIEYGTPSMNGFVFVNGQYLTPPYTVTRRGNGIFINRVQIEQPVPWSYFDPQTDITPEPDPDALVVGGDVMGAESNAAPALQPDPEIVEQEPKKVSSIDDLFGDDAEEKQAPANEPQEKPETISSIDDLFGDGDDAMEKPAPEPPPAEIKKSVSSIDDLFSDDEDDTPAAPPVRRIAPAARRPAPVIRAPADLPPEELEKRKEILKTRLNDQRAFYERGIAKGELYFFGTSHNRINGTYGTARTLMEVLPSALRYANSPSDLLRRLRQGNVYFVDLSICEALYRHKTTFPLLQQRLAKIKQEEAMKAAKRKDIL